MQNRDLAQWLAYIEASHPSEIDLGLTRTQHVFARLGIDFSSAHVITVGGTNGKGTTCALIEQACINNGLSVGVYSSPHLLSFCERIRLNGSNIEQTYLCDIFTQIEQARGDISLTYFEFATLAGMLAFWQQGLEVVVLEVGLGGRLDAVNIVDADIAVITSIGLDHQDWLGDTREKIGFEKAGIFRAKQPVVIGEPDCPCSMLAHAQSLACQIAMRGQDFDYDASKQTVTILTHSFDVAAAKIPKQNVATALMALYQLQVLALEAQQAALSDSACANTLEANAEQAKYHFFNHQKRVQAVINNTSVMGRHQLLQAHIPNVQAAIIADVAHNEDSARTLRSIIDEHVFERCHIVVGMLKDKNIEVSLQAFSGMQVSWHCASLPGTRGAHSSRIASAASASGAVSTDIHEYETVAQAFKQAKSMATPQDLILVMGSFLTVAAVLHD